MRDAIINSKALYDRIAQQMHEMMTKKASRKDSAIQCCIPLRVTVEGKGKRQRSIDESSLEIESQAKRNKDEIPVTGNQGARKEPVTKHGETPVIRKQVARKEPVTKQGETPVIRN